MKIILFDREEFQAIGGIKVFTQRLYMYLQKKGHTVYIFRFTKQKPKESHIIQIPYYVAEERSMILIPSEKSLHVIKTHLSQIKPDIVYTPLGLSTLDFFLPSLCHGLKIPIMSVWHVDFNWKQDSYQLLTKSIFLAYLPLCKQFDAMHVFSQKLSDFYQKKGVEKKRIFVLPNGINSKIYSPGKSTFAKKHKITIGVLFIGRLTLQKNPEILIQSFLSINTNGAKLVIVGQGDQEEKLRNKFQDDRIIFTGPILNEDKKIDIIRSCQVFALPSKFEGLPLALLEAMSCGLGCITSDAGTNRETLEDVGVVLAGSQLKHQLPLALKMLINYPALRKVLGNKARKKVQKLHEEDKIFKKLEQTFKRVSTNYQKNGPPKTNILPFEHIQKNIRILTKYVISKNSIVTPEVIKFLKSLY